MLPRHKYQPEFPFWTPGSCSVYTQPPSFDPASCISFSGAVFASARRNCQPVGKTHHQEILPFSHRLTHRSWGAHNPCRVPLGGPCGHERPALPEPKLADERRPGAGNEGRRASSGLRPELRHVRPTEPQPGREHFCTFGIGHLRVPCRPVPQAESGRTGKPAPRGSIALARL